MTVNKGKVFEQDFKDSLDVFSSMWTYRPSDFGGGQSSRFTNHSLCDFMAFNNTTGNLFLFELKSTQTTSISCPPVKSIISLLEMEMQPLDNLTKEEKKAAHKAIKELTHHLNTYKIKYHQLKSLLEIECNPQYLRMHPYFLLNFRNVNKTFLIAPSNLYQALVDTQKASVNMADIMSHGGIEIEQEQVRKTQHFLYHVEDILNGKN